MGYVWNEADETIYDTEGRKVAIKGRIYPLEKDETGATFFRSESLEKITLLDMPITNEAVRVSFEAGPNHEILIEVIFLVEGRITHQASETLRNTCSLFPAPAE